MNEETNALSGNSLDQPPHNSNQTVDCVPVADLEADGLPATSAEKSIVRPSVSPTGRAGAEAGVVLAGSYTLAELIGEGGMGSVWVANQTEPVKRRVALKLIKSGMDSKAVLARFDAERQALALMDHPNIARVYDGGSTPSGQPFFVMELVQGVPLTEYCDGQRLSVNARLELFVTVCQAVQHAHQKGIIHRDLKPANVLVTEVDGRPTPKVIDFGVAKATELKLTELSFADVGAIVGTPAYMSPEQADPSSMDIDTRTDVYALGVMLYELLTGSPPLDDQVFKRGSILEMLRMVREVEPPRPSTRLSKADTLPSIAANRGIEPTKLPKLLRGELDWVVMKALEKDRNRRYETANALARDLQRYLADEVVEARPPSRSYRLKKFLRRHKGQAIAASLVLLTLVGGIVGTSIGLVRAEQRRVEAEAARQKAEEETRLANGVKDFLKNDVLLLADPATQQADGKLTYDAEVKLRDVVLRASKAIEGKFADRPLVEAELRYTLAFTLYGMGRPDLAVGHLERLRMLYTQHLGQDHSDTLRSKSFLALAYHNLARQADAAKLYEELLAHQKAKLGPDHPDMLLNMNNLANSYHELHRHAEALALREKTLALRKQHLGWDHADTLRSMSNLAASYAAVNRPADALAMVEASLAIQKRKLGADHLDTLRSSQGVAAMYFALNRRAEAVKLFEETLTLQKEKLGADHPETLYGMNNLAGSYFGLNRHAEGLKIREEMLALRQAKLGLHHPIVLGAMTGLSADYLTVAVWQAWRGQDKELGDTIRRALAFASNTKDPVIAERVAKLCSLRPLEDAAQRDAALALARSTVQLGREHPNRAWFRLALGMAEYRSGHFAVADATLAAALAAAGTNGYITRPAAFYRAISLHRQGKVDEARQLASAAAATMRPLPDNAGLDELIVWLAYKEAKQLLGFAAPPEQK